MSAVGNGDRSGSWRRAPAPGEEHGFGETPGWWDARDLPRDDDDVPRLRATLVRALPPLPDGSAVLDLGAGIGTLVTLLSGFYPTVRFTLLDASAAALSRAERKLSAAYPELDVAYVAEAIEPTASERLPGGPYRLVTSSIALHDIARYAASDDEGERARHRREHVALLGRIHASLEPGGHLIYADAVRPRFRVAEHLDALREAGFVEVDCACAVGRLAVCGGQRPSS